MYYFCFHLLFCTFKTTELPKTDALWLVNLNWCIKWLQCDFAAAYFIPLLCKSVSDSLVRSAPQRSAGRRVERRQQRWGWSCHSCFPAERLKQYCFLHSRTTWMIELPCITSVIVLQKAEALTISVAENGLNSPIFSVAPLVACVMEASWKTSQTQHGVTTFCWEAVTLQFLFGALFGVSSVPESPKHSRKSIECLSVSPHINY